MKIAKRHMQGTLIRSGLDIFETIRFLHNLMDCKSALIRTEHLDPFDDVRIYELGLRHRKEQEQSLSFRCATELYRAEMDRNKRARTINERRQVFLRILDKQPEWADSPLSEWDSARCRSVLHECFSSARGRNKGDIQLRGLFRYAMQQKWCRENPMLAIRREKITEREIVVLNLKQIERLLLVSSSMGYRHCAPAVGLMLWAGIRPAEVARLHWEDIDLRERVIHIPPTHSKTGGIRHVTIYPVLLRWLRHNRPESVDDKTLITPPNWVKCWRDLRLESQLQPWVEDTLRHCFASYHLKRFGNLEQLQIEMGHRSSHLLRTNYLNMRGVTQEAARIYWSGRFSQLKV